MALTVQELRDAFAELEDDAEIMCETTVPSGRTMMVPLVMIETGRLPDGQVAVRLGFGQPS